MPGRKPIKRAAELQPLSRDHHHGLLFCWKIRKGVRAGVQPERMVAYKKYFHQAHIIPHFEEEETLLFPIVGSGHPQVIQALEEHASIQQQFLQAATAEEFTKLANALDDHIRFEERVLFNTIQQAATAGQLTELAKHHHQELADDWADEFWK